METSTRRSKMTMDGMRRRTTEGKNRMTSDKTNRSNEETDKMRRRRIAKISYRCTIKLLQIPNLNFLKTTKTSLSQTNLATPSLAPLRPHRLSANKLHLRPYKKDALTPKSSHLCPPIRPANTTRLRRLVSNRNLRLRSRSKSNQ
jgi:hypothetical protein